MVSDNLRIFCTCVCQNYAGFFKIKLEFVKNRFLQTTVSVPITVPVGRALLGCFHVHIWPLDVLLHSAEIWVTCLF